MLKKRVIASLMIKDDLVVQSIGFKKFLPIGKLEIALEFLEYWDVDEIVILDISATKNNKVFNSDLIQKISEKVFIPISIGGGVKTLEDVRKIISNGADKVVLNSSVYNNFNLIKECANSFGKQSVIVCIDVKKENDQYIIYTHSGAKRLEIDLVEYLEKIQKYGVGEILINSIDRDGSKEGYDLALISLVCSKSKVPVIALGGAGTTEDMLKVLQNTKVSGVAAGNMFHFIEHSTAVSKSFLRKNMNNIRLNPYLDYTSFDFDSNCRILPEI